MSKFANQRTLRWKTIEDFLRGSEVICHGRPADVNNSVLIQTGILLQSMMLDDLLTGASPNRTSRIIRWCKTVIKVDFFEMALMVKEVLPVLFRLRARETSYIAFKQRFSNRYPFFGDFLSPIKEEVENYLDMPGASTLRVINQHFSFLTRLSIAIPEFQEQAIVEYKMQEEKLKNLEYDFVAAQDLNIIMREWFVDFNFDEFHPTHGSGAVACLRDKSLLSKYQDTSSDQLLRYFDRRVGGDYSFSCEKELSRVCQVTFVPKTATGLRTISMEPSSLMYYQQGVWRSLDRFMQKQSTLRRVVKIHDQSQNRLYSSLGSSDGSYCTIDLSAASDSVSWELIKDVFKGLPVMAAFFATRSRYGLLPDGSTIELFKFAPMGSALCFPVESLIFAAICEYAVRLSGVRCRDLPYTVYGDDIVVQSHLYSVVLVLLSRFGFTVNSRKSFSTETPFKESCGGEYYLGESVAPLRLSRNFRPAEELTVSHTDLLASYVKMANLATSYGFKTLRSWFVQKLLTLPRHFQPIFGDEEWMVHSVQPTNYHLSVVEKKDWQMYAWRHGTTISKPRRTPQWAEHIRLFEWLRSNALRESYWYDYLTDPGSSEIGTIDTIMVSTTTEFTLYSELGGIEE